VQLWQVVHASAPQGDPIRSWTHSAASGGWRPANACAQDLHCLHHAARHEQHDESERGTVENETKIPEFTQDLRQERE
jgi:hypothetical protein